MKKEDAQKLRAPFPPDAIEQKKIGNLSFAYINHANVTDRLIEVDPTWYWTPIAVNPSTGMPLLDDHNGLWIRLTICGVTRIGYGASEPHQKGADAVKTAVSDAIKNAAMRFWGCSRSVGRRYEWKLRRGFPTFHSAERSNGTGTTGNE